MELQGGGRSDARLQRDVDDANLRAEAAERRLNDLTSELDVMREQLERAKTDIREEQRRTTEAQSKVKSAEDDVKELSEQLAAERQKVQSRRRDDVTDRERAAQRNQEVARYQKENKLLAEENERLNGGSRSSWRSASVCRNRSFRWTTPLRRGAAARLTSRPPPRV